MLRNPKLEQLASLSQEGRKYLDAVAVAQVHMHALQVIKRTLQTALVWTLYEELQPRLLSLCARGRTPPQHDNPPDAR